MGIRSRGTVIQAGFEMPYHGGDVPRGWLLMYGQVVNIADYPRLFAAIGAVHGGDGVTTFGIPDSRGRVTAGRDDMGGTPANRLTTAGSGLDGATLGAAGGGESVTLTSNEMPSHAHSHPNGGVIASSNAINSDAIADTGTGATAFNGSISLNKASLNNTGSSGAHRTVQPSIVANKMIKI